MVKVGIVGSRRFSNYDLMLKVLNQFENNIGEISMVISGGAKGADTLGQRFARERGLPILIRYPNYNRYGKNAPFVRNVLIAQDCSTPESGYMFAFPTPESRGTWHVINKGKQFNVKVYVIETLKSGKIKTYNV